MKQDFLLEGIVQSIGECETLGVVYPHPGRCGQKDCSVVILIFAESGDDYEEAMDLYNEQAGAEVLSMAVISKRHGARSWSMEPWCDEKVDALDHPWIYGEADNNGTRVIGFARLEDEEAFLREAVEDCSEIDRERLRGRLEDFREVRKDMDESKVLVYDGDTCEYDVRDRYPVSWTEDVTDYQVVLFADFQYDEDDCNDMEDFAAYLNVSRHTIAEDYSAFVAEKCAEQGWEFVAAPDSPDWAKWRRTLANGEEIEEVLYTDEDGRFAVR